MHEEIAIVHEDPFGGIETFPTDGKLAHFLQSSVDFVGDGLRLPGIGRGADDEVIGERRDFPEVQDLQVDCFPGFSRFCGRRPVRQVRRGALDRCRYECVIGQVSGALLPIRYYTPRIL